MLRFLCREAVEASPGSSGLCLLLARFLRQEDCLKVESIGVRSAACAGVTTTPFELSFFQPSERRVKLKAWRESNRSLLVRRAVQKRLTVLSYILSIRSGDFFVCGTL